MNTITERTTQSPAITSKQTNMINKLLAEEIGVRSAQIKSAVDLMDGGATVPFIARYRKEATGGLDDGQLRQLEVRLLYVRELEERRETVLVSIDRQGNLNDALKNDILAATTKQRLEDLYAPYKPKRRTRAQIAIEAGLEPLADAIVNDPKCDPAALALTYLNPEVKINDEKAALNGARDILAERFAENADLLAHMRTYLESKGMLYAKVIDGKEQEGNNFQDWFNFHETLHTLPSHRILALLRGRQQGILDLRIGLPPALDEQLPHPCVTRTAEFLRVGARFDAQAPTRDKWLGDVCRWTWRVKLLTAFETEFIGLLRERAEQEAIRVFAANLKDLLLAAPAGPKSVIGLDPGIRTGVKVAVIDPTGKVLDTATIYPFEPRRDRNGALQTLTTLTKRHSVELIAIGNGTASRETEQLVAQLQALISDHTLSRIVVSEAGASVYSASELAAQEFPELDVSLRGAVSIARRLQDPLAELVKIDPKAIGVGQYQHDVNQRELARSLIAVVEDCVNAVGVDVNTASAALLARVSGLNTSLAQHIVDRRNQHGAFPDRQSLLKVTRFGDKTFEQAAGFLRIANGTNPLDASAVHPEAYPVAERILKKISTDTRQILGKQGALQDLSPDSFTDERFGLPTIKDIFQELEKPGRDPRPEFKAVQFKEGVNTLKDLTLGMILEGVVTNVANFGAFIDIGVHQDGLVHISALSDRFIKDPRDVVRVGQTVQVKVMEIEINRKRVGLSMRLDDVPVNETGVAGKTDKPRSQQARKNERPQQQQRCKPRPTTHEANGTMAAAFTKLKQKS